MLSRRLSGNVRIVKIGHGIDKGKSEILCHTVEEARRLVDSLRRHRGTDDSLAGRREYTIIESNRAFDVLDPDLAVFIEGSGERQKSSAPRARKRADIIIAPNAPLPEVEEMLSDKQAFNHEELRRIGDVLRRFHQRLATVSEKENLPSE